MTDEFDMFSEVALVTISPLDAATDYDFQTSISTIELDIGAKSVEFNANVGGGRLARFNPAEETTLTFEAYPIAAGTAGGSGTGEGFFDLQNEGSAADPLELSVDWARKKVRVAILFFQQNYDRPTSAIAEIPVDCRFKRFIFCDGFVSSIKPSFTDSELKYTVEVKVPPYDRRGIAAEETTPPWDGTGSQNIYVQSSKDMPGAGLALGAYTAADKF